MFLIFTISMAIQFTRSYLDTGNSLPSVDPFLRGTMILGLAAGAIFGWAEGTLIVSFASTAGATVTNLRTGR